MTKKNRSLYEKLSKNYGKAKKTGFGQNKRTSSEKQ